jgi:putative peptidoglycan lipid II flippase
MPFFEYAGLAAATAIAFTCASFYGAWALSRNLGQKLDIFSKEWVIKIIISMGLMFSTLFVFKKMLPYPVLSGISMKIVWIITAMLLAVIVYVVSTLQLKCPEWQWIFDAIKTNSNSQKSRM